MSHSPVDKLMWSSNIWSPDKHSQLDTELHRMPVGNLKCVVPSSNVELLEVIGRGSVGIVHKAEWSFQSGKVSIFCIFLYLYRAKQLC